MTHGPGNRPSTKAENAFREVLIAYVARHPGLTSREYTAALAIPAGLGHWDVESVLQQASSDDPGRPARLSMDAAGARFYPRGQAVAAAHGRRVDAAYRRRRAAA
jgi:hypothetical protein